MRAAREALIAELTEANGSRDHSTDMAHRIERGTLVLPKIHSDKAHALAKALVHASVTEQICKAVYGFGYAMPTVREGQTEAGRWRDIASALRRRCHWMLAAAVREYADGLEFHEMAMTGAPHSDRRKDGLAVAEIWFARARALL